MLKQGTKLAAIAIAVVLCFAAVASAQEGPRGVDHYLCYEPSATSGHGKVDVEVRDQFGPGVGIVVKPFRLCNPVDKNGEGILNREGHLVCYTFDPQKFPDAKDHTVETQNQFGNTKMQVAKPDIICVPSFKREVQ